MFGDGGNMVTVEDMADGLPLERPDEPTYPALLPLPPVVITKEGGEMHALETRMLVRMGAAMVAQTTLLVAAMSLLR
jgi:hypothetical protein